MMSFPDRVSKQNCRFGDHHKEDYVKGVEIIVVAGKNPTTRREHNVLSAHDLRDDGFCPETNLWNASRGKH